MEESEPKRPSHIPSKSWDACVQKSSLVVGACTVAGTLISSLFGNSAGAVYGASLGAAWSWKNCRAMFREEKNIPRNLMENSSRGPIGENPLLYVRRSEDFTATKVSIDGKDEEEDEGIEDEEEDDEKDEEKEEKEEEDDLGETCLTNAVEKGDECSFDEPCDDTIVLSPENICPDEDEESCEETAEVEEQARDTDDEHSEPELCSYEKTTEIQIKGKLPAEIWWISKTEDSSSDEVCLCDEKRTKREETEFKLSPVSSIIPKPFKESAKDEMCTCQDEQCTCEN